MVKLTVLHHHPTDVERFDEHHVNAYERRESVPAGLGSPEGQEVAADPPSLPTWDPPALIVGEVEA